MINFKIVIFSVLSFLSGPVFAMDKAESSVVGSKNTKKSLSSLQIIGGAKVSSLFKIFLKGASEGFVKANSKACGICLEDNYILKPKKPIVDIKCCKNSVFCRECIYSWYKTGRTNGKKCPACRKDFKLPVNVADYASWDDGFIDLLNTDNF